jgi:hypothetical protein
MQSQPPFAVPAVVIGIFGILLAGLYVLELAQPVSPTSPSTDSQPAAAAAGANAAPPAQNGVPKEVAPRKLEVRPEIFEKCYRAFVEWNVDTKPLRTEIKVIRIKVKSGDEQAMLKWFEDAASKLECKAYLAGIAQVNDRRYPALVAEAKKAGSLDFLLKQDPEIQAWIDRRLFVPDAKYLTILQKEMPDLDLVDGTWVLQPKSLEEIERQILVLEGAITVSLAE